MLCLIEHMKTAFAVWRQRIAPVFDTAPQIRLVDSTEKRITAETDYLVDSDLSRRIAWLTAHDVQAVVCGAITRPWQERLEAAGFKVFPFVAGEVREVVQAWLSGALRGSAFTMPGCCGRRRMRCGCGGGGCGQQGAGRGRAR
jgi:predicted Fe-Mo cluster-binding NifX family protein